MTSDEQLLRLAEVLEEQLELRQAAADFIDLTNTDLSLSELKQHARDNRGWVFSYEGTDLENILISSQLNALESKIVDPAMSHTQWASILFDYSSKYFYVFYQDPPKSQADIYRKQPERPEKPAWYKFLIPGQQKKWDKMLRLHEDKLQQWRETLQYVALRFKVQKGKLRKPGLLILSRREKRALTRLPSMIDIWIS